MKPEDIRVGDRLRYYPIVGRAHFVPVEILELPRVLGGDWVCRARILTEPNDGRSVYPSVEHLERAESSNRKKPPLRPFTVFGLELGQDVRLEMRAGRAALFVSGTAVHPKGALPEATIRLPLSPLRLRLLSDIRGAARLRR